VSENSFTKKQSPKSSDRAITEVSRYADVKEGGEKKGKAPRVKGLWSRNLWQTQDRWHTGSLAKFSTGANSSQHLCLMPCLCSLYLHKQELQKNIQEKTAGKFKCLSLQYNCNTARPTWKHLQFRTSPRTIKDAGKSDTAQAAGSLCSVRASPSCSPTSFRSLQTLTKAMAGPA